MIVVNFKTYAESSGEKARELGEECFRASEETGEEVIAVPSTIDILRLKDTGAETFAQHMDPENPGSHTGSVLSEHLEKAGVTGTLVNHSEKRLEPERIKQVVEKASEEGLTTIVCAQTPEECGKYSEFGPDFIAYEPPELIGGDVSVSSAKPELIQEAVRKSEVPCLTGAGIKNKADVEKSIELGCEGVLIASGIVKSEKPYEKILELCEGL